MFRTAIVGLFGSIFLSAAALAQQCPSLPYSFTNGSIADATQVMADFNDLWNCAAPAANPQFSGSLRVGIATNMAAAVAQITTSLFTVAPNASTGAFNGAAAWNYYNNGSSPSYSAAYLGYYGTSYSSGLVNGVAADNQGALIFQNVTNGVIASNAETNIIVAPFGSPSAIFTWNGLVGIGTMSPSSSYLLTVNGAVAGVGAYNNISDVRLKKDVVPIADALSMVGKLRGVHFRWRSVEERSVGKDFKVPVAEPQVGFIAQEVKAVLPEAVSTAEGPDAIMSVQESKVVPVLVEAVKQLKAANEQLRATNSSYAECIAKLEKSMTALERKTSPAVRSVGLH